MSVVAIKEEELTLERAIEQQLNLGEKDPHVIYDKLSAQLGAEELLRITAPHLPDLISEVARRTLGNRRRAEVARITEKTLGHPELMLQSLWVPAEEGIVYKRIGDMTAADFDARGNYLDRMTSAIGRHAQWCHDCATQIRRKKVKTAAELKSLPGLPELTK